MLALGRTVAASAPLASAYGRLGNGNKKIGKTMLQGNFLIFFRFPRNVGQHHRVVISNIQMGLKVLTEFGI